MCVHTVTYGYVQLLVVVMLWNQAPQRPSLVPSSSHRVLSITTHCKRCTTMASSSTPASAHDKLSELAQLHTEIAAESKATADKIKLTAEKQEA